MNRKGHPWGSCVDILDEDHLQKYYPHIYQMVLNYGIKIYSVAVGLISELSSLIPLGADKTQDAADSIFTNYFTQMMTVLILQGCESICKFATIQQRCNCVSRQSPFVGIPAESEIEEDTNYCDSNQLSCIAKAEKHFDDNFCEDRARSQSVISR